MSGERAVEVLEVRAIALRSLGVGVASVDLAGRLIGADPLFLAMHGIGADDGEHREAPCGSRWPAALADARSVLTPADREALAAAWTALAAACDGADETRAAVRLESGRTLVIGRSPLGSRGFVLLVMDDTGSAPSDQATGRIVHDVNNALGSLLAHLYLAMSDLDESHPARQWLEAANRSTVELRDHIRKVSGERSPGR